MPYGIHGIDLLDYAQPPYRFRHLTMVAFELRLRSVTHLQDVCDRYLNAPLGRRPGERGHVKPQHAILLVTFSDFPDVSSDVGIESVPGTVSATGFRLVAGYVKYREVCLSFPVVEEGVRDRVSWFAPALFLDGPADLKRADAKATSAEESGNVQRSLGRLIHQTNADWQTIFPIVTGRELFGLPKTRGEIDFDFHFDFSSSAQSGLQVGQVRATTPDRGDLELRDFLTVTTSEARTVPGHIPERVMFVPPGQHVRGWCSGLLGLRPVRDPRDVNKIMSQAVIRSSFELNAYIPGASGTKFDVRFSPHAYPQLFEELGLEQRYEVLGHNVAVFRDAEAVYAKPEDTEVMPCPPEQPVPASLRRP